MDPVYHTAVDRSFHTTRNDFFDDHHYHGIVSIPETLFWKVSGMRETDPLVCEEKKEMSILRCGSLQLKEERVAWALHL